MGIKKKILDAMSIFLGILREKTLQSLEEVEASTTDGYWAGAGAVAELNNNLAQQPEWIKDSAGKITGYKTQEGGAGTVFPFINKLTIPAIGTQIGSDATAQGSYSIDVSKYKKITIGSVVCTGRYAYAQINSDAGNVVTFPTGTNRANVDYDITDYNTISFTLTCQNGGAKLQNIIFD